MNQDSRLLLEWNFDYTTVLSYCSLKPGLGLISPLTLGNEKEKGEHIYTYFHLLFLFLLRKL